MKPAYRAEGLVYYVLDATRRALFVKIGFTTNLRRRLDALRGIATSGQVPIVLALEAGGVHLEKQRHNQFAALRSHGEWFRHEDPLRTFLAELEHPFAYLLDRPQLWCWTGGWGPLTNAAVAQRPYCDEALTQDELMELSDDEKRDEDFPQPFVEF